MRGCRLLNRMPKLPKFAVLASAVTCIARYGCRSVLPRYHELTAETARFFTSSGDASARPTSGLFGLVTSRLGLHPAASTSVAAPARRPSFLMLIMRCIAPESKWELEADRDLTSDGAELRVAESVDAEVEVVARRHFGVEAGVVGPRLQVTADERQLDVVGVAADARPIQDARPEVIAHRELAKLDVGAVVDEVVASDQAVVEPRRVERQRHLLVGRLPGLVLIRMAEVL